MATSSSDESSLAPTDFALSESTEDNHSVISVAVERCPLCSGSRRPFYCQICVERRDFRHSKLQYSPRTSYADKQKSWCILKQERLKLHQRCVEEALPQDSHDVKSTGLDTLRDKVTLLREALSQRKQILSQKKLKLKELQEKNKLRSAKTKKYEEKVHRITKYMGQTVQHVDNSGCQLGDKRADISRLSVGHVNNLVTYIFPITEIQPKSEAECSMAVSTVSALAEARRTSYVRGRWIYADNGGELRYSIVEPTMPGNGDYSSYSIWLATNMEGVPSPEEEPSQRNPHHAVGAALAYTAQCTNIIAFLLDVNVPKRVTFNDFCKDLSEGQFQRAVTNLNYNVLQLCFSQNVSPDLLNYKHTIHNLLTMLQSQHLGRAGHFTVNPELMQSLEEQSHNEVDDDPSSDDDDLDFPLAEWEPVPTSLPEAQFVMSSTTDAVVTGMGSPTGVTSFMASQGGGLMASVASLWRAATGHTDQN